MEWDAQGVFHVGSVEASDAIDVGEVPPEEEDDIDWSDEMAWYDLSCEVLDTEAVKKARAEELSYYHNMRDFQVVPIAQAWARISKAPSGCVGLT